MGEKAGLTKLIVHRSKKNCLLVSNLTETSLGVNDEVAGFDRSLEFVR